MDKIEEAEQTLKKYNQNHIINLLDKLDYEKKKN